MLSCSNTYEDSMCVEAKFVLISNYHNTYEYMYVSDPIFFYPQVKNKP